MKATPNRNKKSSVPRAFYDAVHYWMKKMYGVATKCENKNCTGKSTNYQWALKSSKQYDFKRSHFHQLCRSCHAKSDVTEQTRQRCREGNPNTHKTHCSKGHALTAENVLLINNWRRCKICRRRFRNESQQRRRKALRSALEKVAKDWNKQAEDLMDR